MDQIETPVGACLKKAGLVESALYIATTLGVPLKIVGSQGKIDEAVAHFESAVRLDPTFTAAEHNLAAALAVQGKK